MDETTRFRPQEADQPLVLAPDPNDCVQDHHPACFIQDVGKTIGLAEVCQAYDGPQRDEANARLGGRIKVVSADVGYGGGQLLAEVEARDVWAHIPVRESRNSGMRRR